MDFDSLAQAALWPVAVVIIGLGLAAILRTPISDLIKRTKRAGYGDKIIDFGDAAGAPAAEQERKRTATPAAEAVPRIDTGPPPVAEPWVAPIEEGIYAELKATNYAPDVERAWLVRAIAVSRIMRAHESTYRVIVGSQLQLLVSANAFPRPTLEQARTYFEAAKVAYPAIYAHFDFDTWLNFPKNMGLVSMEGGLISITPLGRDFLQYLVANSLTGPKAG